MSKACAPLVPVAIETWAYGGITGVNDYLMSDGTIKTMRPDEVVWAPRWIKEPEPVKPDKFIIGSEHL